MACLGAGRKFKSLPANRKRRPNANAYSTRVVSKVASPNRPSPAPSLPAEALDFESWRTKLDNGWEPEKSWWDSPEVRQGFLRHLAGTLRLTALDDWHSLKKTDLLTHGGAGLLARHGQSLLQLLQTEFPTGDWMPWRLSGRLPKHWWKSIDNRQRYMAWLQTRLGPRFASLDDWYHLTQAHLLDNHGGFLVQAYNGSLHRIVVETFPNHPWQAFRFSTPLSWWNQPANLRSYFDWLRKTLNWASMDDMYRLDVVTLQNHFARHLADSNSGPVAGLVMKAYPEHEWTVWRFKDYQLQQDDIAGFLTELATTQGWTTLDPWYTVPPSVLRSTPKGRALVGEVGSISALVRRAFPNHPWEPWRFSNSRSSKAQSGDVSSLKSQSIVSLIHKLAENLSIKQLDEWYRIRPRQIPSEDAKVLFRKSRGALVKALRVAYPHHVWEEWRFAQVTRHWWTIPANIKLFLDSVADSLGIQAPSDWYAVRKAALIEMGGLTLIRLNKYSLPAILRKAYPTHKWQAWKFESTPAREWVVPDFQTDQALASFLESIRMKVGLSPDDLEGWYAVKRAELRQKEIRALKALHGLPAVLQRVFPNHKWDSGRFTWIGKRGSQKGILESLKSFVESRDLVEEFPLPRLSAAHPPMTVDVLVKSAQTAVEFQGPQHYFDTFVYGELETNSARDQVKCYVCALSNLKFIEVPYWWDQTRPARGRALLQQALQL